MTRGRWAGLGILAAAAVAIHWLRWPTPEPSPTDAGAPHAVLSPAPRAPASEPEWLGQPGIAPKRIAGIVRRDGKPAPLANVTLYLAVGKLLVADVLTDREGRFDLGAHPAARYFVTALAAGSPGALETLDLTAPSPSPPPDRLELELGPCDSFLYGVVRDVSGGVIAGAEVRAIGSAVSDENGTYELCVRSNGSVQVLADGYATLVAFPRPRKRTRLDFDLAPEVIVAGRVVAGDQPAPGALVEIDTYGGDVSARAAADGSFRFEGLPAGTLWVAARWEGRLARRKLQLPAPGAIEEGVVLSLEEGVLLRGRVVARGGARVAGATVDLTPTDRRGSVQATTQSDGSFAVVATPALYEVEVAAHRVVAPQVVDLRAVRGEVMVTVEPLGRITGRVVRNGAAVARAVVQARAPGADRAAGWATSDAGGQFALEGLEAGTYEINADAPRRDAMATAKTVTVRDGETVGGLIVDLDLAATISGVVVDEEGRPVTGAEVTFRFPERRDVGVDVTGDDGRFEASGMSGGGRYAATVRASNGLPLPPVGEGASVFLADGASRVDGVRLAVQNRRLSIGGVVVRGGKPVRDVPIEVRVEGGVVARTVSDADGHFVFGELVAGQYALWARVPNGETVFANATAGQRDVRVELAELGRIEGELVGFRGPVSVTAMGRGTLTAVVAGDRFTFPEIAAGKHRITASGDGQSDGADVEVVAGKTARVVLGSQGSGTVDGVARDLRTGRPVAGATCSTRPGETRTLTDEAGRFTLPVPAGKEVTVTCAKAAFMQEASQSRTVQTSPGARVTVDIPFLTRRRGEWQGQGVGFRFSDDTETVTQIDAAQNGGVKVGDRLLRVEGFAVTGLGQALILLLLTDRPPGEMAPITVRRGDAELQLEVPVYTRN